MQKPAVSVLIDTYNHERFIEEAIVSVLGQDFPRDAMEVLVVDDGSTDRTSEVVRKFEPKVRLIRKTNGGQASAFNAGIPEARGEIVAFLDGDDWWAPDKLKRAVEAMTADPDLGIVGNGIIMVHRDGREQTEVLCDGFRFQANTVEGAQLFRLRRSLLGTSRMTIRTSLLRKIGQVPGEIRVQADEYLFTLAAVLAWVRILPEPLTFYRYHDDNGFQLANLDPSKFRNKCDSLAALAESLTDQLARSGGDPQASRLITEVVRAEADQIKLMLDGGAPWETLRTEWRLYELYNASAPTLQRIVKLAQLLPAVFLPSRSYYWIRSRLVEHRAYNNVKGYVTSNPARLHVQNEWRPARHTTHSATADKT